MKLGIAALIGACSLLVAGCSNDGAAVAECEDEPVETETGLVYEDLECGSCDEATGGDSVTIEYTAELSDGSRFASSGEQQDGEFVFPLGRGQVISGLDEGVRGMRVGGARRLTIPPEIGYGNAGFPPEVGADATIVYEVTLLAVATGD